MCRKRSFNKTAYEGRINTDKKTQFSLLFIKLLSLELYSRTIIANGKQDYSMMK